MILTTPRSAPARRLHEILLSRGVVTVGEFYLLQSKDIWKFHWQDAVRARQWIAENSDVLEIEPHKYVRLRITYEQSKELDNGR